ncbi:hypothetical protein Ancab_038922 [Ancistrocladus abbreviatus]
MATATPIYPMHSHADFHIRRLPDQMLFDDHPSLPSSTIFVIHFSLRNLDRCFYYSASPSQQDGYQTLSVRAHDEPYGSDAFRVMAVPLHRLTSGDVWAAMSCEFLRLFHLPECCHMPILNSLYSYLASISNNEDLHSRRHGLVRVEVEISRVLCWRSNRTSLITQLNLPIPDGLLQRVKREELEGMDGEDRSCAICLEELTGKEEKGEEVQRLPCFHVFHGGCILKWLKRSDRCPLCRSVLPLPAMGV